MNILQMLNSMSPLGIIALLSYIIYMQVRKGKENKLQIDNLADNHLHELPTILATLQRMETANAAAFAAILAKLNGGRHGN